MNRRNVLGNRIEESKTLWIIVGGMLVTALQFVIYSLIETEWLSLVLAALCALLGSAAIHFITKEQEEILSCLLIPCVFFGALGLLFLYTEGTPFPDSDTVLLGVLFTWLVPVAYAVTYTWIAGHGETASFAKFFRRAIVCFYLVYFGLVVYGSFFYGEAMTEAVPAQWIPFATFAALVNGVMQDVVPVGRVIEFLANRIVFFLPYGFFVGMVCRKLHGMLRIVLLFLLPAVLELLQLVLHRGTCDMDDIIFRLLGSLLGLLAFLAFDALFQHFTARHFDGSEISRDYYGRRI